MIRCVMSGKADQQILADEPANLRGMRVGELDVHAIGTANERKIRAIVDDEKRVVSVAKTTESACGLHYFGRRECLLAQLHDVATALQRSSQWRLGRLTVRARLKDPIVLRQSEPSAATLAHVVWTGQRGLKAIGHSPRLCDGANDGR